MVSTLPRLRTFRLWCRTCGMVAERGVHLDVLARREQTREELRSMMTRSLLELHKDFPHEAVLAWEEKPAPPSPIVARASLPAEAFDSLIARLAYQVDREIMGDDDGGAA